jgi:outer membrane protein OmpA-like peptidoglycan-associated protein
MAAVAAVTLGAAPARAGTTPQSGFAVDTFDPSARGSQWFVLDSLDFRDDGRGALGVVGEYAYKPFVIKNADGSDRATVVSNQLYVHPGGSLVILDRLRLSVDLPIAVVDTGSPGAFNGYTFAAPTEASLGDTQFAADLRMFGRYGDMATASIGLEALAPTGTRAQYTGDGKTRFIPRLQFAGTYDELVWALRAGMLFRTEDDPIAGVTRGAAIVFGGSIGWRPKGANLVVGPELYGNASFTEPSSANSPIEALLGAHYAFAREWRVGLGVGPGLSSGLGTPTLRTALSLEFVSEAMEDRPKKVVHHREGPSDRDHDDVPDTLDACPDKPGPPSVDAAINGCPPPPDTDGDGIQNTLDACPDEKGSPSADPELNGCPPDADQDGIPDAEDACPLRAGVEQTDPKQNGCPPDSDHDGIIDADDACPDVPGAPSKDPDYNGCPYDPDHDKDGIPDEVDACPKEPGPGDPDPKKNGCPRAVLRGGEIRILDQVRFEQNSARIAKGKDSADVLAAVAKVMIQHPEIKKLEVQGHTDNRGDTKANKRLSEQRARAVVKALVAQGLDASRFTAVGYGDERPIDSNTTEDGRKSNRRVEFHTVETSSPSAAPAAPPATPPSAPEEKKP